MGQFKLKVMLKNGGTFKSARQCDSGYDVSAIGFARVALDRDGRGVAGDHILLEEGEGFIIAPHETIMIKTGVHLGLPSPTEYESHYEIIEAQVRPRSGLSYKEHSNVKLGTGDNSYVGELNVILINDGEKSLCIKKHERIAQIVLNKIVKMKESHIEYVDSLDDTSRGSNGFGSTGK